MYKSPIEIIYGQMQTNMENNIYEAVQKYGVNVDKEELIRALQYDRDQYDEGYKDGVKALATKLLDNMYRNSFGEGIIFDGEVIGVVKDMGININGSECGTRMDLI